MTLKNLLIVVTFIGLIAVGCRHSTPNKELVEIEEKGETNPQEAFDSLIAMPSKNLSKADQMYYNLLSVKLADKAFISHTSDSLIISVIGYYSQHGNKNRYAEALYYGGRVYSDMGDYPTALRYYGDALEQTNALPSETLLKGKIASQTASLLHSMRLYDEAKKYIQIAIEIDKVLKDTLNLMYDYRLLGVNNINNKNYDQAEYDFGNALSIAKEIDSEEIPIYTVYLAAIKHYKMKPDSAANILKDIPYRTKDLLQDDDSKQFVYSYAADIYRCANMPDSAYKYALDLIRIKDARNLRKGYSILLSDALKEVVPQDSIRNYINRYRTLTEEYMNSNGDRNALIQNSLYNYSVIERDKEKALEKKRAVERWLTASVMLLLILISVVLYYRYRSNRTQLQLHQALENVSKLRELLNQERNSRIDTGNDTQSEDEESLQELRTRLKDELNSLCRSRKNRQPLSPVIAESKAYATLQDYIENQRTIPDSNPLWEELHMVISDASPNFDKRIQLLSGGQLKDLGYRIMLLIKCGVTPTQLCFLVGKTKGTLSYQRRMLGVQWLKQEIDPRLIDNLIYSL